jgi:hypothetical protein
MMLRGSDLIVQPRQRDEKGKGEGRGWGEEETYTAP